MFLANNLYVLVNGSTVRCFNVESGTLSHTYEAKEKIFCVSQDANHLYTLSPHGLLQQFTLNQFECKNTWQLNGPITHAVFCHGNDLSVVYKSQQYIYKWTSTSNISSQCMHHVHTECLAICHDLQYIIATHKANVALYDCSTASEMTYTHNASITSVAIHNQLPHISLGDSTGRITTFHSFIPEEWQRETAGLRHWHAHAVSALAYTLDDMEGPGHLLSGGEERVLLDWDLAHGKKFECLPRLYGEIVSISTSTCGRYYAVTCTGNATYIIRADGLRVQSVISQVHNHSLLQAELREQLISVNPLRSFVVPTQSEPQLCSQHGRDGSLQWFEPTNDFIVKEMDTVYQNVVSRHGNEALPEVVLSFVAYEPKGQGMITIDTLESKHTLKFWQSPQQLNTIVNESHTKPITCLSWSPMGHSAVTCSMDGLFKVWTRTTLQHHEKLSTATQAQSLWSCTFSSSFKGYAATCATFSPDGSVLVVAFEHVLTLWDTQTWEMIKVFHAPNLNSHASIWSLHWHQAYPHHLVQVSSQRIVVWNMTSISTAWIIRGEIATCAWDDLTGSFAIGFGKSFSAVDSVVAFHPKTPMPTSVWRFPRRARGVVALVFANSQLYMMNFAGKISALTHGSDEMDLDTPIFHTPQNVLEEKDEAAVLSASFDELEMNQCRGDVSSMLNVTSGGLIHVSQMYDAYMQGAMGMKGRRL